MSQEELAEKAGNSHKHVSLVELGKTNVGLDTLTRIANGLAVDVSALFEPPGSRGTVALITASELDAIVAAGRVADRLRRADGRARRKR